MVLAVVGLFVGIVAGILWPVHIPPEYAKYMSVALLASLDSVFGGLRAGQDGHFDNVVFSSGFFMNAILAAGLIFIGERLNIDLYYVALLAFGLRIFQNLAILRRHYLKR